MKVVFVRTRKSVVVCIFVHVTSRKHVVILIHVRLCCHLSYIDKECIFVHPYIGMFKRSSYKQAIRRENVVVNHHINRSEPFNNFNFLSNNSKIELVPKNLRQGDNLPLV